MGGVSPPFNEKGEKAVAVIGKVDRFPIEDVAVRALSGAVRRAGEFHFVFAKLLGEGGGGGGRDSPADEARIGHRADLRKVNDFRLRGIGRNDFQIAALTEREERVARATAGMDSTDGGQRATSVVNKFDAFIEVAASENNVIEQS